MMTTQSTSTALRWGDFFNSLTFNLLGLLTMGMLAVASADNEGQHVAMKQGFHILVGLGFLAATVRSSPSSWRKLSGIFYAVSVALLIVVMLPGIGQSANGSQRWLSLGPMGALQPSELAKFSLIFVLAALYAPVARDPEEGPPRVGLLRYLVGGALTAVPFALIAKQPDLGTALVLGAIYLGLSFVAGMPVWFLLGLVGSAVSILPHTLKQYQKDRLLIFMNPEHDPMGLGYHLLQSRTAIGSGGFWGTGLFRGSMTQNGFVPENWTDFIFSVIGEETGMLGALGVLALGVLFCSQLIYTTFTCRDRFTALCSAGVVAMLGFQWLVNMSMTIGLAPVVGIPLPFFSYGGSAMFVNLASVGVVLRARRGA